MEARRSLLYLIQIDGPGPDYLPGVAWEDIVARSAQIAVVNAHSAQVVEDADTRVYGTLVRFGLDGPLHGELVDRKAREFAALLKRELEAHGISVGDPRIDYAPETLAAEDTLDLWVDPGEAAPQVVAEVLLALSELYRAEGGSGLVFHMDGEYVVPAEAAL